MSDDATYSGSVSVAGSDVILWRPQQSKLKKESNYKKQEQRNISREVMMAQEDLSMRRRERESERQSEGPNVKFSVGEYSYPPRQQRFEPFYSYDQFSNPSIGSGNIEEEKGEKEVKRQVSSAPSIPSLSIPPRYPVTPDRNRTFNVKPRDTTFFRDNDSTNKPSTTPPPPPSLSSSNISQLISPINELGNNTTNGETVPNLFRSLFGPKNDDDSSYQQSTRSSIRSYSEYANSTPSPNICTPPPEFYLACFNPTVAPARLYSLLLEDPVMATKSANEVVPGSFGDELPLTILSQNTQIFQLHSPLDQQSLGQSGSDITESGGSPSSVGTMKKKPTETNNPEPIQRTATVSPLTSSIMTSQNHTAEKKSTDPSGFEIPQHYVTLYQFLDALMESNPMAIHEKSSNNDNMIPFLPVIFDWVSKSRSIIYNHKKEQMRPSAIQEEDETVNPPNMSGKSPFSKKIGDSVVSRPIVKNQMPSNNNIDSSSSCCIHVDRVVEWAFLALSLSLKHSAAQNGGGDLITIREVASIIPAPMLLQSIVHISDDAVRHRIFAYPIVRLSILASASIPMPRTVAPLVDNSKIVTPMTSNRKKVESVSASLSMRSLFKKNYKKDDEMDVTEADCDEEDDKKKETIMNTIDYNEGKYAIHYIAEYATILSTNLRDVESIVFDLIEAYPEAVALGYSCGGCLPFTTAVKEWSSDLRTTTSSKTVLTTKTPADHISAITTDEFPIPTVVDWSFCMLTSILQQLESRARYINNNNNNGNNIEQGRPHTATTRITELSHDFTSKISSIKYLVKSILLIHNTSMKKHILAYPIVKRILLSENSAGSWLVYMFKQTKDPILREKAVEYLNMVSKMTPQEYYCVNKSHKLSSGDVAYFQAQKNALFCAVGKLNGFLPIILGSNKLSTVPKNFVNAGGKKGDDYAKRLIASSLPSFRSSGPTLLEIFSHNSSFINTVLDEIIQTPFVVWIFLFDALFLFLMLLGLRLYVHASHDHITLKESDQLILSPSFFTTLISSCYLTIREIGTISYLYGNYSWRKVASHFSSLWNVIDFTTMFVVIGSIIAAEIDRKFSSHDFISTPVLTGLSFATASCWIKVISFLRKMNLNFSTLISSLGVVFRDILQLLMLFSLFTIGFSQVMYTSFPTSFLCVTTTAGENSDELCSPGDYYLTAYSFFVGYLDFDQETLFRHPATAFFFVFYSAVVVILFMNFLIAKVSDSFDKSMMERKKSIDDFIKRRLEWASQVVAIESMLQHGYKFNKNVYYDKITILLCFSMLVMVEVLAISFWNESVGSLVAGILCTNLGLTLVATLLFVVAFDSKKNTKTDKTSIIPRTLHFVTAPIRVGENISPNKWSGRIKYITNHTQKMLSDSELRLWNDMNVSLERMEVRLQSCIKEEMQQVLYRSFEKGSI